jgi:hypothetical protein
LHQFFPRGLRPVTAVQERREPIPGGFGLDILSRTTLNSGNRAQAALRCGNPKGDRQVTVLFFAGCDAADIPTVRRVTISVAAAALPGSGRNVRHILRGRDP